MVVHELSWSAWKIYRCRSAAAVARPTSSGERVEITSGRGDVATIAAVIPRPPRLLRLLVHVWLTPDSWNPVAGPAYARETDAPIREVPRLWRRNLSPKQGDLSSVRNPEDSGLPLLRECRAFQRTVNHGAQPPLPLSVRQSEFSQRRAAKRGRWPPHPLGESIWAKSHQLEWAPARQATWAVSWPRIGQPEDLAGPTALASPPSVHTLGRTE
jgi:hypothetical protein